MTALFIIEIILCILGIALSTTLVTVLIKEFIANKIKFIANKNKIETFKFN